MHAAKMPVRDAHRFIAAVLPGVSLRKLQRWNRLKEASEYLSVPKKLCGRPKVVYEEQFGLLVRWMLGQTDFGCIVKMEDARLV